MSSKKKTASTKKKTTAKSGSKTTKKKTTTKKGKIIADAKKSLIEMKETLRETAISLPSLVLMKETQAEDINGLIDGRFEVNTELIEMLETFFERLVILLKLRSSFDKQLHQIYRYIKHLDKIESTAEFKGNLQILGISLMEIEQTVKDYQEIYANLFTEQALLQFQLMEQLMMFRDKDLPNFLDIFKSSIDTFRAITDKISNLDE